MLARVGDKAIVPAAVLANALPISLGTALSVRRGTNADDEARPSHVVIHQSGGDLYPIPSARNALVNGVCERYIPLPLEISDSLPTSPKLVLEVFARTVHLFFARSSFSVGPFRTVQLASPHRRSTGTFSFIHLVGVQAFQDLKHILLLYLEHVKGRVVII